MPIKPALRVLSSQLLLLVVHRCKKIAIRANTYKSGEFFCASDVQGLKQNGPDLDPGQVDRFDDNGLLLHSREDIRISSLSTNDTDHIWFD